MLRFALDGITGFLRCAPEGGDARAALPVSGMAFLVMLYTLYARFVTQRLRAGLALADGEHPVSGRRAADYRRHHRRVSWPGWGPTCGNGRSTSCRKATCRPRLLAAGGLSGNQAAGLLRIR
ncbi:MAG: hypothetical protein WKG07_22525 [Hymenobacter sp.]